MAYTRRQSRTPYWRATRLRNAAAPASFVASSDGMTPCLASAAKHVAVSSGQFPPGIGQPVHGEIEARLDRDEDIERDDLARGPVGGERLGRGWQDRSDPLGRVADRRDLRGDDRSIDHVWPRRAARRRHSDPRRASSRGSRAVPALCAPRMRRGPARRGGGRPGRSDTRARPAPRPGGPDRRRGRPRTQLRRQGPERVHVASGARAKRDRDVGVASGMGGAARDRAEQECVGDVRLRFEHFAQRVLHAASLTRASDDHVRAFSSRPAPRWVLGSGQTISRSRPGCAGATATGRRGARAW